MRMASIAQHHSKTAGSAIGAEARFVLSDPRNRPSRLHAPVGQKIRNAARGQSCTLRLPGCNGDPDTTIFAHAPSIDNGMGIKTAPDWWGAFACSHCHDVVDSRVTTSAQRILIMERWFAGVYETQKRLIGMGLITYNDS